MRPTKIIHNKVLNFLYLLGLRIFKLRNREALWKLYKNYPFVPTTTPILGCVKQVTYNRIRTIEGEISKGSIVLDAGCNTGELGSYMLTRGCIVYGIDVNPHFVETAKKRGLFARTCPVEKLTFSDSFFDVCVATELLEHIYKPEEAVAELYRVLKLGGVLIGTVPSPYNKFAYASKFQHIYHQHDFNIGKLRELLKKFFKPKNILIRKYNVTDRRKFALHFKAVK